MEFIIKYPLSKIKNNDHLSFNIKKMQLQEFNSILLQDDFVQSVIRDVKSYLEVTKKNDQKLLLHLQFLEETDSEPNNEMGDFEHYVKNKLDSFNNKTEEKFNNSEEIWGNNMCNSLDNLNNLNNNDNITTITAMIIITTVL